MRTIQGFGLLLLLASGISPDRAQAQNYPTRPIHLFTSAAGSGSDFMARLLGNELSTSLGQPAVIENRPGGVILGSAVAKSAPDGHALLVWAAALWVGPLFEKVPYDAVRDFAPITTLTRAPLLLVVHPSMAAQSVADLIKLAKARPGQLNVATSAATASSAQIATELFKSMAGVDIVRVAYKASAQASADLLSGQVQMAFDSGASAEPLIKAGKLRALGSGGMQRSALFPSLPTVAETLPGFVSESLLAMWAPGKTPEAIVRRLNQETVRVLQKPEMRERLLQSGQEPAAGTPEQLAEIMRSDIARTEKLIKDGALKIGGA